MSLNNKLKSNYRKTVKTALSDISAMLTLLNNYPVTTNTNPLLENGNANNSISFSINLLKILGLTETDLINFFVRMFKSDSEGFLNALEESVKAILLVNIKKFFDCDVNPLLPNVFFKKYRKDFPEIEDTGIFINLDDIDINRILDKSPFERHIDTWSKNISYTNGTIVSYRDSFYMLNDDSGEPYKSDLNPEQDTKWVITYNDDLNNTSNRRNRLDAGSNYYFDCLQTDTTKSYTPNTVWKSMDFNCYLWYVKNRQVFNNKRQRTWDNRVKDKLDGLFKKSEDYKNEFFDKDFSEDYTFGIKDKDGRNLNRFRKFPIIETTYLPGDGVNYKNRFNVKISDYYCDREIQITKTKSIRHNATIFEFNRDFIYSIKLFDRKTLIASIINAVTGLNLSTTISLSDEEKIIKGYIENAVYNIMSADDTEISDCYFNFSEKDYIRELGKTEESYTEGRLSANNEGKYGIKLSDTDIQEINSLLSQLDDAELVGEDETVAISNVFMSVMSKMKRVNDSLDTHYNKISFGSFIIDKMIHETAQQIVMSVLSPKVGFLFMINSAVMGDLLNTDGKEDFKIISKDGWAGFLNNLPNLIADIVVEIKRLILEYIKEEIAKTIAPLVIKFELKLIKENIDDWRTLLKQVLEACMLSIGRFRNKYGNLQIDNVGYADIYEEDIKNTKKSENC